MAHLRLVSTPVVELAQYSPWLTAIVVLTVACIVAAALVVTSTLL